MFVVSVGGFQFHTTVQRFVQCMSNIKGIRRVFEKYNQRRNGRLFVVNVVNEDGRGQGGGCIPVVGWILRENVPF